MTSRSARLCPECLTFLNNLFGLCTFRGSFPTPLLPRPRLAHLLRMNFRSDHFLPIPYLLGDHLPTNRDKTCPHNQAYALLQVSEQLPIGHRLALARDTSSPRESVSHWRTPTASLPVSDPAVFLSRLSKWHRANHRLISDRTRFDRVVSLALLQLSQVQFGRLIPSNLHSIPRRFHPGSAPKRFRCFHGDTIPATLLRDLDQRSDNFRMFASRRQLGATVDECRRAVREEIVTVYLEKTLAHRFRHGCGHNERFTIRLLR